MVEKTQKATRRALTADEADKVTLLLAETSRNVRDAVAVLENRRRVPASEVDRLAKVLHMLHLTAVNVRDAYAPCPLRVGVVVEEWLRSQSLAGRVEEYLRGNGETEE